MTSPSAIEVIKEEAIDQPVSFNFHKCEWCDFGTKSHRVLLSHSKNHQISSKSHGFSCESANLESFECQFCYYKTDLKIVLDKHENLVHIAHCPDDEMELQSYICDKCDFETYSVLIFARHVCDESQLKETTTEGTKNKKLVKSGGRKKVQLFECQHCSYKTNSKRYLKKHTLAMHTKNAKVECYKCQWCSHKTKYMNPLKRHILLTHLQGKDVEWFESDQRLYKGKLVGFLRAQLGEQDTNDKWFQCEQCSYVTEKERDLRNHIIFQHSRKLSNDSEVKWFECEHCPFKATARASFKRHVSYVHGDPKKVEWFKCNKCSYKAKLRSSLKRHTFWAHSNST